MKNYTLTILKVLAEWLEEKGWNVGNIYVGDNEASDFANLIYFVNFERYEDDILVEFFRREFPQSELDAQADSDKKIKDRSNGHIDRDTVREYIRAELEEQGNVQKI